MNTTTDKPTREPLRLEYNGVDMGQITLMHTHVEPSENGGPAKHILRVETESPCTQSERERLKLPVGESAYGDGKLGGPMPLTDCEVRGIREMPENPIGHKGLVGDIIMPVDDGDWIEEKP